MDLKLFIGLHQITYELFTFCVERGEGWKSLKMEFKVWKWKYGCESLKTQEKECVEGKLEFEREKQSPKHQFKDGQLLKKNLSIKYIRMKNEP